MSKRLFLYAGPFDRFPLSWQKKSNSAVTPEVQGWPICEMSLTVLGIVLLPATMLKQTCLLLACLAACLPPSLGLRLLPDMEEQCSQPLGLQDGSIRSRTFIFLSEPLTKSRSVDFYSFHFIVCDKSNHRILCCISSNIFLFLPFYFSCHKRQLSLLIFT